MSPRVFAAFGAVAAVLAAVSWSSVPAAGQAQTNNAGWTAPRMPWGDPDLQGIWSFDGMAGAPLERPAEFANKPTLTDEEVKARIMNRTGGAEGHLAGGAAYGAEWLDASPKGQGFGGRREYDAYSKQSAFVVDPPDGKLPPLTPEGQKAVAERVRAATDSRVFPPKSWKDLSSWDRCITMGLPYGATFRPAYNTGLQIVQGPGNVTLLKEMIHEARVVPVDGRPHLGPKLVQFLGDSRGHWEGDTLVVEVTNFNGKGPFSTDGTGVHLVERFTRTGPDTMEYRATIEDAAMWTRSWTAMMTATKDDRQYELVEYACHEANYGVPHFLSGLRAERRGTGKKSR